MSAVTPVNLPAMGEGIHEARVNRWLKQEGDTVQRDEPLLEVSTDKVDTEIVAPCAGVLQRIVAQAETTVAVGTLLAEIAAAGTQVSATAPQPTAAVSKSEAQAKESTTASVAPSERATNTMPTRVLASPLVRKIAAEQGIDLTQVAGSGLQGRITVRDLKAYQHTAPTEKNEDEHGAEQESGSSKQVSKQSELDEQSHTTHPVYQQDGQEYQDGVAVRREGMSRMRRLIAAHMTTSVRVAPHVTTVFEVDVERIGAARQRQEEEFQQRTGFRLTWTAFFVHIAALCLKKFPLLNVSLDGNDILWKDNINIGCAVAVEHGLIVPVVKNAGELSLLDTAARLQDLVERARSKRLAANEVRGGTFTITNPGIYGSLTSNPIINQPQVAILGLGRIAPTVVVIDNMLAVRQTMLVSLTFDHRVIDGETGAKFLAAYRDLAQEFT